MGAAYLRRKAYPQAPEIFAAGNFEVYLLAFGTKNYPVMDNPNIHQPAALYETLLPAEAKRLRNRFESISAPEYGSWLNRIEFELRVLLCQCLGRRIEGIETMQQEGEPWQKTATTKR